MIEKPKVFTATAEILLVEDDANDIELTLHAFERQHIVSRIQVVRDGAEALDYLFAAGAYAGRNGREQPRLVVLDLKLPRIDGLDVLARIRTDPRTSAIPVVILTSSRHESDLEEAYHLGANSYIVKPVEFDRFTEIVEQLGHYWLAINEQPPSLQEIPPNL